MSKSPTPVHGCFSQTRYRSVVAFEPILKRQKKGLHRRIDGLIHQSQVPKSRFFRHRRAKRECLRCIGNRTFKSKPRQNKPLYRDQARHASRPDPVILSTLLVSRAYLEWRGLKQFWGVKHPFVELVSAEQTSGGYKPHARKKFAPPPRIASGRFVGVGRAWNFAFMVAATCCSARTSRTEAEKPPHCETHSVFLQSTPCGLTSFGKGKGDEREKVTGGFFCRRIFCQAQPISSVCHSFVDGQRGASCTTDHVFRPLHLPIPHLQMVGHDLHTFA
ncbi:hypothetical protein Q31b_43390 [Novipirellula aureliae]|uniref:Uncharacterized protein n=1 Tax=Novipirellula aureliae TaxID=2527966 RepID=A0A5C6DPI1_9BACT|nr:hypothetical protein Q31b_43390 [Novipirellula aureliae]